MAAGPTDAEFREMLAAGPTDAELRAMSSCADIGREATNDSARERPGVTFPVTLKAATGWRR